MSWDPQHHFTHYGYRKHIQTAALKTLRGEYTAPIGGKIFFPYWWIENKINVFWEARISRETVDVITAAVDERIRETISLPFHFNLCGSHPSAMQQIAGATINGQIDYERLFAAALSEDWRDVGRGGEQHADIYITTKPFLGDKASWGAADFNFGAMVLCLHGDRSQDSDFLRTLTLHETTHLLGMRSHCDDFQNVEGFTYIPTCNMHYKCPSNDLCPKCLEYVRNWWTQIEATTS